MQLPKLKTSTLALSAALAAMTPAVALAAAPPSCRNSPISTSTSSTITWSSGNCSISSSGSIVVVTQNATGLSVTVNSTSSTLGNSGTISGSLNGINNTGRIGTINNSGTISGTDVNGAYGIFNTANGRIGALNNLANGTISGTYSAISNLGLITTLSNQAGAVISSDGFTIVNNGTITTLNNSGTIRSQSIVLYNAGGKIGALNNSGLISSQGGGLGNSTTGTAATIGTLTNSGTIRTEGAGIYNAGGTITALLNSGTIDSQGNGIANTTTATTATIGTLTNSGSITGSGIGIYNNAGTITTLSNTNVISSSNDNGISNSNGTIGTLTNDGAISSGGFYGINNDHGTINALSNTGAISSAHTGIANTGTIGRLANSGSISGVVTGIYNPGSIGVLDNASGGAIGPGAATGSNAIFNSGTITALNNDGLIAGPTGIRTQGNIGTLVNSGTITGTLYAFYNASTGTVGAISNPGVMAGNIRNTSIRDLNISGGTGEVFGTLTGFGGGVDAAHIGAITNVSANVVFSSGNLLLNDNIDVTGHTVTNSGATLQVNNTIGITGNYRQNAAATLNIGVADNAATTGVASADSGYGRLVVSGSATIDAGSSVTLKKVGSYAFAQGQRYVVVQAANGNAHFNEGSLNYSAIGYSGAAVTGASVTDSDNAANTDLMLTIGTYVPPPPSNPTGPTDPVSPPAPINSATEPGAVASLAGLFNYTGTNANMLDLFNAAAATGGSGEANRAGEQLSPAGTGAALVQSVQVATQAVINVASAHIDAIRVAQAAGSGDSGIATGERPGDVAVWGQAFGGQANQSDRAGASGYRAGYNGMLIGADTAIGDQWRAGGLVSYANTSIANTGNNTGSSGHVSSYGLTGYAGYAGEKWYLDLSAGAVQQKYNTLRAVDFSGFSGGALGQFDGMQYIASAQAGYPIRLDTLTTLTPIAGVTYSRLHQDGYTETGSAAALQIGSASTSSIKSDLGARLERSFKTSYGDMIPSAQLSWRHEYRNTGLQSVGNFAADTTGTTSFTTQGAAPEKDTGVLVLGVTLARSENLSLAAHYTLEAASGYTAQTADVRLRYQF